MPRRKRERGRPMKRLYPPRIDATPEEVAQALFRAPPGFVMEERDYRCSDCGRGVHYPEVLHRDNRCSGCHASARD